VQRKESEEKKEKNLVISCLVFFTLAHLQGDLFISEEADHRIQVHGAKENITKEFRTQHRKFK
jgi:hypothetical protein